MTIETKSAHVTSVGGNVFIDLGFDSEEAEVLQAESKRIISEKLAIKESLIIALVEWINDKKIRDDVDVTKILGVTKQAVLNILNKESIEFTIDALVDMLARTGKHIQLVIQ